MRSVSDTKQAERLLESFAERARQEEQAAYKRRQAFQSAAELIGDARMDREDAEWAKRGKLAMPKPFDAHALILELLTPGIEPKASQEPSVVGLAAEPVLEGRGKSALSTRAALHDGESK
jgi:hypothetical protein